MATIKEHIAQHTRSEAATQQQPVADDPLALNHHHDNEARLTRPPARPATPSSRHG